MIAKTEKMLKRVMKGRAMRVLELGVSTLAQCTIPHLCDILAEAPTNRLLDHAHHAVILALVLVWPVPILDVLSITWGISAVRYLLETTGNGEEIKVQTLLDIDHEEVEGPLQPDNDHEEETEVEVLLDPDHEEEVEVDDLLQADTEYEEDLEVEALLQPDVDQDEEMEVEILLDPDYEEEREVELHLLDDGFQRIVKKRKRTPKPERKTSVFWGRFPVRRRRGPELSVEDPDKEKSLRFEVELEHHHTVVRPAYQQGNVARRSGISRLACRSYVPASDDDDAMANNAPPDAPPEDVDNMPQVNDAPLAAPDAAPLIDVPVQHDPVIQRRAPPRRSPRLRNRA
ncbi:hypothetical protein FRB94_014042 [Tulasnella sp. JGI-2019a]|nr:hypothetical protein FRB94_014042 [Tulasnella sp. JGI-2019a]